MTTPRAARAGRAGRAGPAAPSARQDERDARRPASASPDSGAAGRGHAASAGDRQRARRQRRARPTEPPPPRPRSRPRPARPRRASAIPRRRRSRSAPNPAKTATARYGQQQRLGREAEPLHGRQIRDGQREPSARAQRVPEPDQRRRGEHACAGGARGRATRRRRGASAQRPEVEAQEIGEALGEEPAAPPLLDRRATASPGRRGTRTCSRTTGWSSLPSATSRGKPAAPHAVAQRVGGEQPAGRRRGRPRSRARAAQAPGGARPRRVLDQRQRQAEQRRPGPRTRGPASLSDDGDDGGRRRRPSARREAPPAAGRATTSGRQGQRLQEDVQVERRTARGRPIEYTAPGHERARAARRRARARAAYAASAASGKCRVSSQETAAGPGNSACSRSTG